MDEETKNVFSRGERLRHLVNSEGWADVEDILNQQLADLQNVFNVTGNTPEEAFYDIKARRVAADYIKKIFDGIRHGVEQHEDNFISDEDFVVRYAPERARKKARVKSK